MAQRKGLGKGLGALIQDAAVTAEPTAAAPASGGGAQTILITEIRRNPLQPRKRFDPEAIDELASSIREHGVIQPLLLRSVEGGYEIIAGERRFQASRKAGLSEVPAIIRSANEVDTLALALIENLQRENLNVIEEAEGYAQLAETHGLTQEQIAKQMGKARASIANAMRLLALPEDVVSMLRDGALSAGHAKVLLGLEAVSDQMLLAKRVAKEGLSVRALERAVDGVGRPPKKPRARKSDIPNSHVDHLADLLQRHLSAPVRVTPSTTLANGKKAKGTIEVDFFSNDELDQILSVLGLSEQE